jgi:hypothetical protein
MMPRVPQAGETFLTRSKLFVAAMAVTAVFATPAFAQWQPPGPAALDRNHPSTATRDSVANTPSVKSPRPTVIRATKGQ